MIVSEFFIIGYLLKLLIFNGNSEYFPLGSHFLNEDEVKRIERYLLEFPLEDITIGDAGEINNCQVGRLMEDQPTPQYLRTIQYKDHKNHYIKSLIN